MRGKLVIVSSPSGAGKTTLTRRLLAEFDTIDFSVSYTTRPQRPGEVNGIDYHFVETAVFEQMAQHGEFAEHALVHGNRYGTARAPIEAALTRGRDVIFDVDWQGGASLSAQWPQESVKIFILPPSLAALAERLHRRATDSQEVITRRLHKALEELGHFREYSHLIVNDDLERAYGLLKAVYVTARYGAPPATDDGLAAGANPSRHEHCSVPLAVRRQLAAVVLQNPAQAATDHALGLLAAGASW
ncbi:MAG: guanylate kinase [Myxococcales bacterium]|nr:guanylate kinase [Myxococcales bacterium]